jgi:hypothetical protein
MSDPIPNVRYWYDKNTPGWRAPGRPTLSVGRDQLIPGNYFPDGSNTGLLSSYLGFTVVSTGITYSTTSPRIISNTRYTSTVTVTGSNITFRNCLFEGPASGAFTNIVNLRFATTSNIVFEDCLFSPQTPSDAVNNIFGRGYTLRRCELRRAVDGASVVPAVGGTRTDVVMEGCWIHDLGGFNTTTQADGFTHNDGIQWHGGLGLRLLGCRIEGFLDPTISDPGPQGNNSTSIVMINNLVDPGEMHFEKNWFDGGVVGINMLGDPGAFPAGASPPNAIIDNHFGFDYSSGQNNAIRCISTAQVFTLTGNHRWFVAGDPFDTSTPFNTRVNG